MKDIVKRLMTELENDYKHDDLFSNIEKKKVHDVKEKIMSALFERNRNKHELLMRNREFLQKEKEAYFGKQHPSSGSGTTSGKKVDTLLSGVTHFTIVHITTIPPLYNEREQKGGSGFPVNHLTKEQKEQLEKLRQSQQNFQRQMQEQYHNYPQNDIRRKP
ncbi:hypothetical protein PPL_11709 [Heterostelium album PN500]|uniref:Uncharacterized protein n=1 Tax=Heterostelium pallidum (strain ATCC 26659 / Pp 5 / PN500) TaxID=670386 RepID=D3BU90_HETP5|nr:hypothetical protein PPL_11709 [Heterostelium album PN500]EFA75024.1 hypothetical protein PPL_11709 [Heterostelium album PN500]|eukprot:XP_020427158.1 hypothetical protein PPL_11709 [Heterostelium album PN500]